MREIIKRLLLLTLTPFFTYSAILAQTDSSFFFKDLNTPIQFEKKKASLVIDERSFEFEFIDSLTVSCHVYTRAGSSSRLVQSGYYSKTPCKVQNIIMVPDPLRPGTFVDSSFYVQRQRFKKNGIWINHWTHKNITYYQGEALWKDVHKLVYFEELDTIILLKNGYHQGELNKSDFYFQENSTQDSIQVLQISGYNRLETSFFVQRGVRKFLKTKAVTKSSWKIEPKWMECYWYQKVE